jgi:hypothetical protein
MASIRETADDGEGSRREQAGTGRGLGDPALWCSLASSRGSSRRTRRYQRLSHWRNILLLLFAGGRLSAPFAQSAGWGDIITGLLAIPLAARAISGQALFRPKIAAWNAFGALDLLVPIALAFLSAPGTPYRVFMDPSGTIVMTTLPWIAVATIFVPLYVLTHFTIAARLRSADMRNLAKQEPAAAGRKRP